MRVLQVSVYHVCFVGIPLKKGWGKSTRGKLS